MIRRSIAALAIAPFCVALAQTDPAPAQRPATPPASSPSAASTPSPETRAPAAKPGPNKPKPTASAKPAVKGESPAAWFQRVFGIDVRAYANLTAVRGQREVEPAPRLVVFDRQTGKEETLWKCGGCWSPFPYGSNLYVLRQTNDDATSAELWVLRSDGKTERVVSLPLAIAIIGLEGNRLIAGVPAARCDDSPEGGNALVAVDLTSGKAASLSDSPCLGTLGLASSARIRGDRYLDTTHKADLSGNRRDRSIQVLTPATGETPTAKFFDAAHLGRGVDRYDPVWITDDRIAYVANP